MAGGESDSRRVTRWLSDRITPAVAAAEVTRPGRSPLGRDLRRGCVCQTLRYQFHLVAVRTPPARPAAPRRGRAVYRYRERYKVSQPRRRRLEAASDAEAAKRRRDTIATFRFNMQVMGRHHEAKRHEPIVDRPIRYRFEPIKRGRKELWEIINDLRAEGNLAAIEALLDPLRHH